MLLGEVVLWAGQTLTRYMVMLLGLVPRGLMVVAEHPEQLEAHLSQ